MLYPQYRFNGVSRSDSAMNNQSIAGRMQGEENSMVFLDTFRIRYNRVSRRNTAFGQSLNNGPTATYPVRFSVASGKDFSTPNLTTG